MRQVARRFVVMLALLGGAVAFAAPPRTAGVPTSPLFFSVQWQAAGRTFSQIYTMQADGSQRVCLTPSSESDYRPALSPKGDTLAFTTHRDGVRAIYLMNPDGTHQRRLTKGDDAGLCAWSPDGKQLAFSSNRNGVYCIYVMNADGTNVRRVTDGPSEDYPVWSPDGRAIAYEGRQGATWRIYVMKADGSARRQVTTEKWDSRWPAWSPDGSRIAYTSYEQGNGDIYTMRPSGAKVTRVTDNPAEDRQPVWVGNRLLFHSNRAGHFDVFETRVGGHDEHRLTVEARDTVEVTTGKVSLAAVRTNDGPFGQPRGFN